MTHEDAFIAAIIANPADDAVRLIYADWLDGQGREEMGEFIRVQVELAGLRCEDGRILNETGGSGACRGCVRWRELRSREHELWGYLHRRDGILSAMKAELPEWALLLPSDDGRWLTHHYPWAWVCRGFIAEVRLSCQDWMQHGPALVRRHPIERCVLTTCIPLCHTGLLRRVYTWAGGENSPTTPSHLPHAIFSQIDWEEAYPSDNSHGYDGWPTESAALDALEKAALLYARQTEPAMV